ncbi:MAG: hypothetical protein JXB00_05970 [Bacteroidales bacterium]|nr:hypothetical protein [Bacteroidales bacterium]
MEKRNQPDLDKGNDQLNYKDLQIISFASGKEWRNWLEQNHQTYAGIWLRIYKKGTGISSINHDEALDEALCYGWIDGQARKYDEESYLQKFTPRRKRSTWSKRNIEHIARLEQEGKMKPSGWKEVEAAKADGRWDKAYDSPRNMEIPEDFLFELSKDKKALDFFKTLNKTNLYAIG